MMSLVPLSTSEKANPSFSVTRKYLLDKAREIFSNALYGWLTTFRNKPLEVTRKPLLVFAPHQDDETFGCGGLILLKRQQGIPVHVVFMTDGAASHGGMTDTNRDLLISVRQKESLVASKLLNLQPDDLEYLGYPDKKLTALDQSNREALIKRVIRILNEYNPGEILVPHRHDRHPDHEATYDVVTSAVARSGLVTEIYQYSIWAVWWSAFGLRFRRADLSGAFTLDISPVHEQKISAIEAYKSQIDILPSGFLKHFYKPYEIFFARSYSD